MALDRLAAFRAFATFKNRLSDFADEKNQALIDYLIAFQYGSGYDFKYPTTATIVESLDVPAHKVNSQINSLYERLLNELSEKEQVISVVKYDLRITLLFEDDFKRKTKLTSYNFACTLPFVPRVGDQIELPFLDKKKYYRSGYVHDVKHTIDGREQVIEILVHPFNNPYENYLELKKEYEEKLRFRREIKMVR